MLTLNYANLEIMSNGREASTQSLNKNTCLFKIKILIVDDDSTSLAIVSSMLKSCSLQGIISSYFFYYMIFLFNHN